MLFKITNWIKLISISFNNFFIFKFIFKIKLEDESRLFLLLIQIELFLCEKDNKYLEDIIVIWFNDNMFQIISF